ncbi:hypothetical protein C8R46DRAFT_141588 [Mycena filopes]|nr:hypothetical protein C8R46DRAFT_141588 [Mycena filopes]
MQQQIATSRLTYLAALQEPTSSSSFPTTPYFVHRRCSRLHSRYWLVSSSGVFCALQLNLCLLSHDPGSDSWLFPSVPLDNGRHTGSRRGRYGVCWSRYRMDGAEARLSSPVDASGLANISTRSSAVMQASEEFWSHVRHTHYLRYSRNTAHDPEVYANAHGVRAIQTLPRACTPPNPIREILELDFGDGGFPPASVITHGPNSLHSDFQVNPLRTSPSLWPAS